MKESTVEWHSVIEFKALVVCLIPIDLYTFVVFLNYVDQVSFFKVNVKNKKYLSYEILPSIIKYTILFCFLLETLPSHTIHDAKNKPKK